MHIAAHHNQLTQQIITVANMPIAVAIVEIRIGFRHKKRRAKWSSEG